MLEHLKWWWGWCWWQCISNVKGSLLLVADDEDGNYVDIDDDIYLNNAVMIIKAGDAFKTRCGNPGLRWTCLGRSLQTMVVAISTGSVPGSSLTLFLYSLLSFSNDDDDDDPRRPIQLLRVDWRLLPEDSPPLHRPPGLNVLTKTKVCHRLHHNTSTPIMKLDQIW